MRNSMDVAKVGPMFDPTVHLPPASDNDVSAKFLPNVPTSFIILYFFMFDEELLKSCDVVRETSCIK